MTTLRAFLIVAGPACVAYSYIAQLLLGIHDAFHYARLEAGQEIEALRRVWRTGEFR